MSLYKNNYSNKNRSLNKSNSLNFSYSNLNASSGSLNSSYSTLKNSSGNLNASNASSYSLNTLLASAFINTEPNELLDTSLSTVSDAPTVSTQRNDVAGFGSVVSQGFASIVRSNVSKALSLTSEGSVSHDVSTETVSELSATFFQKRIQKDAHVVGLESLRRNSLGTILDITSEESAETISASLSTTSSMLEDDITVDTSDTYCTDVETKLYSTTPYVVINPHGAAPLYSTPSLSSATPLYNTTFPHTTLQNIETPQSSAPEELLIKNTALATALAAKTKLTYVNYPKDKTETHDNDGIMLDKYTANLCDDLKNYGLLNLATKVSYLEYRLKKMVNDYKKRYNIIRKTNHTLVSNIPEMQAKYIEIKKAYEEDTTSIKDYIKQLNETLQDKKGLNKCTPKIEKILMARNKLVYEDIVNKNFPCNMAGHPIYESSV